MEKRVSCRAILFIDDHIALMHRIKEDREYYTFPGGGVETSDLTKEDTVKREVMEEFGIDVNSKRLIYIYENDNSIQYFYVCEMINGMFGTGNGPEMTNFCSEKGYYFPELIKVSSIKDIPLEPSKLAKKLIEEIEKYGQSLGGEITKIVD